MGKSRGESGAGGRASELCNVVAAGFGACADIDVILGVEGNAEDAARTGAVKGVDDVVDDVVEKEELANAPSRRCADVEFALANLNFRRRGKRIRGT